MSTPLEAHSAASQRAARTKKRLAEALGTVAVCSRCGEPRDGSGSWCSKCRAAYMREDYRRREAAPGPGKVLPALADRCKTSRGTEAAMAQAAAAANQDRVGQAAEAVGRELTGAARRESREQREERLMEIARQLRADLQHIDAFLASPARDRQLDAIERVLGEAQRLALAVRAKLAEAGKLAEDEGEDNRGSSDGG